MKTRSSRRCVQFTEYLYLLNWREKIPFRWDEPLKGLLGLADKLLVWSAEVDREGSVDKAFRQHRRFIRASHWKAAKLAMLEVTFCFRRMASIPGVPFILDFLPMSSSNMLLKTYKEFSETCTWKHVRAYGRFCSEKCVLVELSPPCGRVFFLLFLHNVCLLVTKVFGHK